MTTGPAAIGAPDPVEPRAAGVWTLAGDRLIIAAPEGPATILVPSEQVRLLAVDLPLPSRAKRLAALPFAIEDMIAEPVDSVHIALGGELSPGRWLVGVVRHEVMAGWIALAAESGLGGAAMVPDVLALPRLEGWAVDQAGGRALVRTSDGAGFAVPAALLRPAWEAAGRPPVQSFGEALADDMQRSAGVLDPALAVTAAGLLNLRQGAYAARGTGLPNFWRRLGWIIALGAAAHIVIALGDTVMLRVIAERREADTRALAALAAPGVNLSGDVAATVADLLPSGAGAAPSVFLPLVTRVSSALAPLSGTLSVRAMDFQGNALTMDIDAADPGLPARIDAALKSARIAGQVTRSPDGSIRVTASGA